MQARSFSRTKRHLRKQTVTTTGPEGHNDPPKATSKKPPALTYILGPRSEENSQWKMTITRLLASKGTMGFFSRNSSTSSSMGRLTAPCEEEEEPSSRPTAPCGSTESCSELWCFTTRGSDLDVPPLVLVGVAAVHDHTALDGAAEMPAQHCHHLWEHSASHCVSALGGGGVCGAAPPLPFRGRCT